MSVSAPTGTSNPSLSSEEEEDEVWVPFGERLEWSDVVPLPQDDGPNPVVPIAYTERFRETMDYFRAVLAMDERSERALKLTREVIKLNAGNYTVWYFRRLVLEALSCDLWEELEFLEKIAESNYKNYQIWHHRRWTVETIGPAALANELRFTEEVFEDDAKNYHAWSHRQWVLRSLGGWESELAFCHKLLQRDIYNNSAWNQVLPRHLASRVIYDVYISIFIGRDWNVVFEGNLSPSNTIFGIKLTKASYTKDHNQVIKLLSHDRYFVIKNSPHLGGVQAMRDSELRYCIDAIRVDSSNESSWRYMKGLFKGEDDSLIKSKVVEQACLEELTRNKDCIFALDLLLDLLCLGFKPSDEYKSLFDLDETEGAFQLASFLCMHLKKVDSMRALYWDWRLVTLKVP